MNVKRKRPRIFGDEVWKYEIILRKCEYYLNVKRHPILRRYYYARHHFRSVKLGILIPPNAFASGGRGVQGGGLGATPAGGGGYNRYYTSGRDVRQGAGRARAKARG